MGQRAESATYLPYRTTSFYGATHEFALPKPLFNYLFHVVQTGDSATVTADVTPHSCHAAW